MILCNGYDDNGNDVMRWVFGYLCFGIAYIHTVCRCCFDVCTIDTYSTMMYLHACLWIDMYSVCWIYPGWHECTCMYASITKDEYGESRFVSTVLLLGWVLLVS